MTEENTTTPTLEISSIPKYQATDEEKAELKQLAEKLPLCYVEVKRPVKITSKQYQALVNGNPKLNRRQKRQQIKKYGHRDDMHQLVPILEPTDHYENIVKAWEDDKVEGVHRYYKWVDEQVKWFNENYPKINSENNLP